MTQAPNKFAAILHARTAPSDVTTESVVVETKLPKVAALSLPSRPQKRPQQNAPKETAAQAPVTPIRPGGKGKSSDPSFKQVTAYIPQELHNNATIALRVANQSRIDAEKEDFSELLTRLLANWYEKQVFYKPNA